MEECFLETFFNGGILRHRCEVNVDDRDVDVGRGSVEDSQRNVPVEEMVARGGLEYGASSDLHGQDGKLDLCC